MYIKKPLLLALLGATLSLPLLVQAQPGQGAWPGGGPGPYSPWGAGNYGASNPYATELNELATRNPEKHDACYKQADAKNLYREERWTFMLDCLKK